MTVRPWLGSSDPERHDPGMVIRNNHSLGGPGLNSRCGEGQDAVSRVLALISVRVRVGAGTSD